MSHDVMITGASTGIGETTARQLAARGWHVFAGVRREEDAQRLRSASIEPLRVDVTDTREIEAAVNAVQAARPNGLDGLVANAGIAIPGPLESIAVEEFRRQLEVNVIGVHATIRAFLPLVRRARGRIVIVGSIAGRSAFPFIGPYVTSKFALEGYSDALRLELIPAGVRVILLEPGSIATPIWQKGRDEYQARLAGMSDDQRAAYGAAIERMTKATRDLARSGIPAERVAEVIQGALEAPNPKARYVIGRRARVQAAMAHLPDRFKDTMIARMLRLRRP